MKISQLGEFGLIALVAQHVARLGKPERLLLGIGDDAAVWESEPGLELATTDTLVQDVHFRFGAISWRDLGWKALAVNLSDIAAMGGSPSYALVTLALPPETEAEDVAAFYDGMAEMAQLHEVSIAGGDMVTSPVVMITVSLTGHVPQPRAGQAPYLRRAAARVGDVIAVTGHLGASAAGLRLFLGHGKGSPDAEQALKAAHLRPQPRLSEGCLLREAGVQCAIDISDGLIADLRHVCEASGVAARVEAPKAPVHPEAVAVFGNEALALALAGGEDYELLFTAPENVVSHVRERASLPVTVIGEIVAGLAGEVAVLDEAGRPVPRDRGGWDHFRAG